MKFKILGLAVALISCCPAVANSQLIINELMQSNIDCIMDDLNDYPDSWVELYNPTGGTISLDGYAISLSNDVNDAYILPANDIVEAFGHYLVYCDKADTGRHTDFRLESGKGGSVYLFHQGECIDKVEGLKKMPAPNVAYGRSADDSDTWGYQLNPTPGKPNEGGISDFVLDEPVFSRKGMVTSSPFELDLTLPSDAPNGTVIRFTLDGSEPTPQSDEWGQPLFIMSNCVVRAKLFAEGCISPRSTTHSYIFHPREMSMPIISIVTDNEMLYSDEIGIMSDHVGDDGVANVMKDWRRPINFEFFNSDNKKSELNMICETRLKGFGSRGGLLNSMALYANKRFGTKRFEYEFFPEQKPGLTDFKSIELRNAGNDRNYTYMKDAVIQRIMGMNVDIDWQAYQPVVVYINGNYHGLLNLRERGNEDNIYTNYDGLEDIDLVENWNAVEEGTPDELNKLKSFYAEAGHLYDEYAEYLDIEEFISYHIMEFYFDNIDFPGNNCLMWRPRTSDGKWRWIAKDLDLTLGLYNHPYDFPTFDWFYDSTLFPAWSWANTESSTLLFRRTMEVDKFRDLFIDRMMLYMGDFMGPEFTCDMIDRTETMIEKEYPSHCEVNVDPDYRTIHKALVKNMKQWVYNRHDYMAQHLSDFWSLGRMVSVKVENSDDQECDIVINGFGLRSGRFDGKYYAGGELKLEASSDDGRIAKAWSVCEKHGNNETTQLISGANIVYKVPDNADSVTIMPVMSDSGVEAIADGTQSKIDYTLPYEVFNLQGVKVDGPVNSLTAGIYVVRQGCNVIRIVAK